MTENQKQLRPEITPAALAALGMPYLAYVKPVLEHGTVRYALHHADGSAIVVMDSREVAFAAARQHDLEPVSVH